MKKFLFAAILSAFAAHASASTIYTTSAGFNSALTNKTTVNFDTLAAPGGLTQYTNSTLSTQGVNITSPGFLYAISGNYGGMSYAVNSSISAYGSASLHVVLPGASNAIGFDYRAYNGNAEDYTITFSDNEVFNFHGASDAAFFGAVLNNAVNSFTLSFSGGTSAAAIDNLTFATAATTTVPEPGSVALIGLGMLGLATVRRRRSAK